MEFLFFSWFIQLCYFNLKFWSLCWVCHRQHNFEYSFSTGFDFFTLVCLGLQLRAVLFHSQAYKSKMYFLMCQLTNNVTVQAIVYFRYSWCDHFLPQFWVLGEDQYHLRSWRWPKLTGQTNRQGLGTAARALSQWLWSWWHGNTRNYFNWNILYRPNHYPCCCGYLAGQEVSTFL